MSRARTKDNAANLAARAFSRRSTSAMRGTSVWGGRSWTASWWKTAMMPYGKERIWNGTGTKKGAGADPHCDCGGSTCHSAQELQMPAASSPVELGEDGRAYVLEDASLPQGTPGTLGPVRCGPLAPLARPIAWSWRSIRAAIWSNP
jgi:hypothetical protein